MRKFLFLLSAVSILSCNREDETKSNYNNLSDEVSLRGGVKGGVFDGGVMVDDEPIYFNPSNLRCSGPGIPMEGIPNLPNPIFLSEKNQVASGFNNNIPANYNLYAVHVLSELLVEYLNQQGITILESPIFDNTTPIKSSFNSFSYSELTFTDGKITNSQPDYFGFPQYSFMDKVKANNIIKNVYNKILNNPQFSNNEIKAIRMYYEQYLCNVDQGSSVDYKIQIIY